MRNLIDGHARLVWTAAARMGELIAATLLFAAFGALFGFGLLVELGTDLERDR